MTNPLIAARSAFSRHVPEVRRSVNGRDWGIIRTGAGGPALVLLPGTLGRADIFWQQISALSDDARILAISYPGTGGIEDWAKDLADLIIAEDMTGATVLGSSLGGYVAQYLTGVYPDICGGLIAANTLPDASIVRAVPPYALDLHSVPAEALREGFLGGLKGWLTPDHPYADLAGLLIAEVEGRIPEPELRARLLALKTAPRLPAQRLPDDRVFTVQSEDDHLIAPPVRAALRATLQPARAYCFTAASHFPYVTRADDYTAILRETLSLDAVGTHWPKGGETVL